MLLLQQTPDVVRLPLAYDKLLLVAEGQHPAMAGDRGHLADVIRVHDGVAVHALKARRGQAGFHRSKCLRRQEAALSRHDPDQLAFSLQSQNFIQIE